jgi:hypothetical protein
VDADNDVLNGIRRTSEVMASKAYRVNIDCSNERRECEIYAWDPKLAERGEEAPLKHNDHTQDAKRYAVMEMFPDWRMLSVVNNIEV